jgi:hypothetical protein
MLSLLCGRPARAADLLADDIGVLAEDAVLWGYPLVQTGRDLAGAEGSLTVLVQHEAPADTSNWLPAPEGPYQLIFRTHQPGPALLDRSYQLPPLGRV